MPAAVLAATRRAGSDLGPTALSQAACLGPTKRRGLLRALEPKSCQRITRFMALEALKPWCHCKQLARDVDLESSRDDHCVGQDSIGAGVAHGDRAAVLAAVTRRRKLADVPAVHEDRLASPGECARIVEGEEHEPLAQLLRLLPLQRFATDERRGLVQLDRI